MNDCAIIVHGGAGTDNDFIRKHDEKYEIALGEICRTGYDKLKHGKKAIDVVYDVLEMLENDALFNAGRGAALNEFGKIEMDAAVMDGKSLMTGAVALLQNVKNPILLVKEIAKDTSYAFFGAHGALALAKEKNLPLEPESYFVTDHQVEMFLKARSNKKLEEKLNEKVHSTTGVAVKDKWGNVASGTSSGGVEAKMSGRIGDGCVIGCGCYANNETCAVSTSGDGEYLIRSVAAHYVACHMEFTGSDIQTACDAMIHVKNKGIKGDIGVIGVDNKGNIGVSFNCERMHRAWIGTDGVLKVMNYK